MTFFFDNTFPPQLVTILKALKVDARHLQDDFPADTPDVDWLPEVGRQGWVVVTGDRRISSIHDSFDAPVSCYLSDVEGKSY